MDADRLLAKAQELILEEVQKGTMELDATLIAWLEDTGDYLQVAGVSLRG